MTRALGRPRSMIYMIGVYLGVSLAVFAETIISAIEYLKGEKHE
jgi:hypothetical protein